MNGTSCVLGVWRNGARLALDGWGAKKRLSRLREQWEHFAKSKELVTSPKEIKAGKDL